MNLIINEEQQMLKTSAKEFLKNKMPVAALRKLRDDNDEKGYDPQAWKEMAEMGWASLTIPEEYGGMNFDFVGFGQVLEEMGKTLAASPMVSTCLVSATLINLGGSVMQKEYYLPQIADGNLLVSLASEESNTHQPFKISTQFSKTENGFSLSGKKVFVLDGNVANYFIVSATDAENGGVTLFMVDAKSEGIKVERKKMMDSRNAATVTFENVEVPEKNLLGEIGKGKKVLEKTLDIARIGLAAEMLGSMQEAFDRTVNYLKERKQFRVVIGTFQALQHRAAHMYCEIQICKSIVLKALQAIDEDSAMLPMMASMAKSKVGETLQLVTNEGIQLYGGIGMTDDEEIGFFMKRARVAQQTFGDYNYHLTRFAKLSGF